MPYQQIDKEHYPQLYKNKRQRVVLSAIGTGREQGAHLRDLRRATGFGERSVRKVIEDMLIIVKAVQMAADGNLKAAEFIRDTLGENPQYKIYEKRLEYLIADKEAAHTLADEWVASIPDWEE